MVLIPSWIEQEAWDGFVEMRKLIKKPMTARAASMLIHRLEKMKDRGHDTNACIDQSTFHSWQDVYPLKDKEIPNMNRQSMPKETPRTAEQKAADNAARLKVMSVLRPVIKLVKTA